MFEYLKTLATAASQGAYFARIADQYSGRPMEMGNALRAAVNETFGGDAFVSEAPAVGVGPATEVPATEDQATEAVAA